LGGAGFGCWVGADLGVAGDDAEQWGFQGLLLVAVTVSRLAALVGTYLSVVGIFLVARIPVILRCVVVGLIRRLVL
jgi:hypothetical protein